MASLILLLVVFLGLVLFVFPLWAFLRIRRLTDELRELRDHVQRTPSASAPVYSAPAPVTPSVQEMPLPTPSVLPVQKDDEAEAHRPAPLPLEELAPPVSPVGVAPETRSAAKEEHQDNLPSEGLLPPAPSEEPVLKAPRFNWERFMGVKLFAWLGGLAAFLGVAFGVKYSFEHDLIPPELRAAGGFLLSVGFLIAGLRLPKPRYAVTGLTLCATGIVSLYAVSFACRSVYQFPFFTAGATFALMVLVTVTAFLLAVRLEAKVVAVLGIVGGFLTPWVLSSGQDNPLGLFGYIGLLNAGLCAVALNRRWGFLVVLGLIGTVLMEFGWMASFLTPAKADTAMLVCLSMVAVYLVAFAASVRLEVLRGKLALAVSVLAFLGFGVAFYVGLDSPAGLAPLRWLAFVALLDLAVLGLAWWYAGAARAHFWAGSLVFALLSTWISQRVGLEQLPWALAAVFVFTLLHGLFPLGLQRRHVDINQGRWAQLFPVVALVLILGPVLSHEGITWWVWPTVLALNGVALVLAWLLGSVASVVVMLVLTLATAGRWVFDVPSASSSLIALLAVVGGFALLFSGFGLHCWRRLSAAPSSPGGSSSPDPWVRHLPVLAVLLPFVLLILITQSVGLSNPTPVFGLMLLLVVLALGMTRILFAEWLPVGGLVGTAAVIWVWHRNYLHATEVPALAVAWEIGFVALFTVFPFIFQRSLSPWRGPWIASALASVLLFRPIYSLLMQRELWPLEVRGLVPLVFALPMLAALVRILKTDTEDELGRIRRLALYGGALLFFITLIIPIQFSQQWITLGWALEGAALLWLYRRVPHRGLIWVGLGLLVICFARLAFNPSVLLYQKTGYAPVFNWYLYTYGLVAACLFVSARLSAPLEIRLWRWSWSSILDALGTVLLFLLLNIEIADFFSTPEQAALVFEFSGNFARDLSYTIGWALFAFGLLIAGVWRRVAGARYAALGLLGITLLKLFFHDLAHLGALYRIAALFGVALIAMAASLVYQRFLPSHDKTVSPPRA